MFTPRDDPTPAQIIDDTLLSLTGSAGDLPSTAVSNSVNLAKKSAWNTSLTVITNARSFQYNFTGFPRIAVYGSTLPPASGALLAMANYTLDGNFTVASVPNVKNVITDYPLFVSERLDPTAQHTLYVNITASPDAPYLLDYLLAYQDAAPTPISSSNNSSITSTATGTPSATSGTSSSSSLSSALKPYVWPVIASLSGLIVLLLITVITLASALCKRRRSRLPPSKSLGDGVVSPFTNPFPPRPEPSDFGSTTKASLRSAAVPPPSRPAVVAPPSRSAVVPPPSRSMSELIQPLNTPGTPFMTANDLFPNDSRYPPLLPSQPSSSLAIATAPALTWQAPIAEPPRAPTPVQLHNPYSPVATPEPSVVGHSAPAATSAYSAVAMSESSARATSSIGYSTPTASALGPNEYPREKQEVRLEPPTQGMYVANAVPDAASHTYGAAEGHGESPPAYRG